MVDLDLSFGAELKATLDGIAASTARQERHLAAAQEAMDHIPLDVPIMRSGTTNATGVAIISCGGPARGRQWQVRQLAVSGPIKGVVRLLALPTAPTSPFDMGLKDATNTRWHLTSMTGAHSRAEISQAMVTLAAHRAHTRITSTADPQQTHAK